MMMMYRKFPNRGKVVTMDQKLHIKCGSLCVLLLDRFRGLCTVSTGQKIGRANRTRSPVKAERFTVNASGFGLDNLPLSFPYNPFSAISFDEIQSITSHPTSHHPADLFLGR